MPVYFLLFFEYIFFLNHSQRDYSTVRMLRNNWVICSYSVIVECVKYEFNFWNCSLFIR